MSSSRGIGKVGMLILTSALGVVTSYVIWRLKATPKPQPPDVVVQPPKAPVRTQIAGIVVDSATTRLITGAKVTLAAKGFSGSQDTDSFGGYLFTVDDIDPSTPATLQIAASGFNSLMLNRTVDEFSHQADQMLTRQPAPPPPPPGSGAGHGAMIGSHAVVALGPIASPATRKLRTDYVRIGPQH